MSGRRHKAPLTVTVEQPAKLPHSAVLVGPVRAVQPAIRAVGCPSQYDGLRHGFKVPRDRLDDVLSAIESAGHRVDVKAALW